MSNEFEAAADQRLIERRLAELESKVAEHGRTSAEHEKRLTRAELLHENLKELAKEFISRQEFTPIRMIVYGLGATALTGLLSAILSKVLVQ